VAEQSVFDELRNLVNKIDESEHKSIIDFYNASNVSEGDFKKDFSTFLIFLRSRVNFEGEPAHLMESVNTMLGVSIEADVGSALNFKSVDQSLSSAGHVDVSSRKDSVDKRSPENKMPGKPNINFGFGQV